MAILATLLVLVAATTPPTLPVTGLTAASTAAGTVAAATVTATSTAARPVVTAAGTTDPLIAAVTAALPAAPEATGTRVAVLRRDPAGWAFGTAVQLAPARRHAYPAGWLWLARDGGAAGAETTQWSVTLEGSAAFAGLSRQAPVLTGSERERLGVGEEAVVEQATVSDYRTGMRLPYARGQTWAYTGGPHPMGGTARSSIDLAGGDGLVRAARAGLAYRLCQGWVRVIHDRGFATDYYHLHGTISAAGRWVAEGDVLGEIGTDVTCGGSATGPHVHFSLRRDGSYVDIDRYGIGKWTVRAGAGSYEGSAWHGSRQVGVGGGLYNYGRLRLTEGVVDTTTGGPLNRRDGPGTGYAVIGTIPDGATVEVACSARGTTHAGRGGYTSDLWNQLVDGGWVSDVYLWTGTAAPVAGDC